MDGDGHNAKAFAWQDEAAERPVRAFDPSAVLRRIEDEDDAPAPAAAPARPEADFGAALRAAMALGAAPESEPSVAPHAAAEAGEDWQDESEDWAEEAGDWPLEAEEPESSDIEAEDDDIFAAQEGEEDDAPEAATVCLPMDALDVPGRKPRVALMGEFSAGKSTLSNLLIGASPLPMKVTATQLPPVWISWGDGQAYREDLDGETHPIDIARLSEIDPAETRMIRIFAKSDILERCDIIDMPGISDPNMDSEVWERVIGKADGVLWCTHATQAWRQSEASVWESLDPALHAKSLLLVTRFDKLHGETDRARVMRRVERETEGLFAARLPISLTEALSAGDDADLLERSGAAAFRRQLLALLDRVARGLGNTPPDRETRMADTLARDGQVNRMAGSGTSGPVAASRILPRRVRPTSEMAAPRALPDDRDLAR